MFPSLTEGKVGDRLIEVEDVECEEVHEHFDIVEVGGLPGACGQHLEWEKLFGFAIDGNDFAVNDEARQLVLLTFHVAAYVLHQVHVGLSDVL